ncbi:MAG TPA: hypothetical protein VFA70_06350 [Dehalococcoidia bacterium]|jgi:hypothetical protein|nr:hypothetical protein [Dehalococcoidia bacterium]
MAGYEQPSPKDALLARFLGDSLDHDQEDIEFWRTASDELRGRTLWRLLVQGRYIAKAVPNTIAAQEDRTRLILKPKAMSIITDYE